MANLLLIRHGENDYVKKGRLAGRIPGVHLNQTGQSQSLRLAEILAKVPVKAIYSSPLERTLETAEPIANSLGLPIIQLAGLLEMDYGEWQDQPLKLLRKQKLWKLIQESPSRVRFPGGESFLEAQSRICQEIEQIVAVHAKNDLVICVSHADPIKLVICQYLGMPLDSFQRIFVAPGSMTMLQINDKSSQLVFSNFDLSLTILNA